MEDSDSPADSFDEWNALMAEAEHGVALECSLGVSAPPPPLRPPSPEPQAAAAVDTSRAHDDMHSPMVCHPFPEPTGDIHALWWAPIKESLEPFMALRGKQVREVLLTSQCTGLCSEPQIYNIAGLQHQILWTADPKIESFRFIQDNLKCKTGCHFRDIVELGDTGEGWCMVHGKRCKAPTPHQLGRKVTSMSSGLSCCGFSTAFQKRLSEGGFVHPESHLFHAFIDMLIRDDADSGFIENVFGMLVKSKKDAIAPIVLIIAESNRRAPQYSVRVFFLDSETYLVLSRKRVFIHVFHQRVGGRDAHRRMARMLQASRVLI